MLLGELEDFQAGRFTVHDEIGDDHIERAVEEFILGLRETVNDCAHMAGLAKGFGHDLGVIDLIIDDEDLRVKVRLDGAA